MTDFANKKDKFIIYQIFTRLFGNQNTTNQFYGSIEQNGVGKFNDITDTALQAIKEFGISHVWYTGIIEHATTTDYSKFGILSDNPLLVKGKAGSPYAIKDYYDVDPDLAVEVDHRMEEFEALVQRTHAADLKVLIDFVPNHVSRQYSSDKRPAGVLDFGEGDRVDVPFDQQNNFYYLPGQSFRSPEDIDSPFINTIPYDEKPAKATGNDVFHANPSLYDWYETIKLNYGVDYSNGRASHFDPIPSTWVKMRDILLYWAKKGVDGFRCDMAEMVPVEFWGWVISAIKSYSSDILFIAEIYNPGEYHRYIREGKFDYLYDKVGLYNYLRPLMEGEGSVENITRLWQHESGDIARHMLRFLENHDEQRIASRFFANDAKVGIPAMTLCGTLHTGPLMHYFGQEVGVNPTRAEGFQGDDGRTTIFDYWGVDEMQGWINGGKFDGAGLSAEQKNLRQFYRDLNYFVVTTEAIASGHFYDLQYLNIDGQSPAYDRLKTFSYLRYTANQTLVCIYNFDKYKSINTLVKIPAEPIGMADKTMYALEEIFPEKVFTAKLPGGTLSSVGIPVTLPPCSVKIVEIKSL